MLKFLQCKDKFHKDRKETDLIADVCVNTMSHKVWKAIEKLRLKIPLNDKGKKPTGKERREYVVKELEVCSICFTFYVFQLTMLVV